jgi:hypothetical protein
MMTIRIAILAATLSLIGACAEAACPNPLTNILIPLTGSVTVEICDQSGNVLAGPYNVYNGVSSGFPVVNGTTVPSVSTVSGSLQFASNGAPSGTAGNFTICFSPASKCSTIPYSVGAPVTAVSFGSP